MFAKKTRCPGWVLFSVYGGIFMALVAVVSISLLLVAGKENAAILSDHIQLLVTKSVTLQMDRMFDEIQSTTRVLQTNDPAILKDLLPLPNDSYDPSVLFSQMDIMEELPGQGMISLGYALVDPVHQTKTVYEMSRSLLSECGSNFAYGVASKYTNFFYLARCVYHDDGALLNVTRLHQSRVVYNGSNFGFSDLEHRVLQGAYPDGVFLPIRVLLNVFTLVWNQPKWQQKNGTGTVITGFTFATKSLGDLNRFLILLTQRSLPQTFIYIVEEDTGFLVSTSDALVTTYIPPPLSDPWGPGQRIAVSASEDSRISASLHDGHGNDNSWRVWSSSYSRSGLQWKIVVMVPEEVITESFERRERNAIWITTGITIGLVIVLAAILYFCWSQPLFQMQQSGMYMPVSSGEQKLSSFFGISEVDGFRHAITPPPPHPPPPPPVTATATAAVVANKHTETKTEINLQVIPQHK